jgi:hypothetical protein
MRRWIRILRRRRRRRRMRRISEWLVHALVLALFLSLSLALITMGYIVGFNSAALGLAGVSEWAGGFHACCFLCTCNGYFLHWHWVWRSSPQRFWLILINSTGWESPI